MSAGKAARHVVAKAADIAIGERLAVTIANREIAVFNVKGEFFALANRCPHEGGPLCGGLISGIALSDGPNQYRIARKGEFIRCPWHGWEFDIKTGQSWCDPKSVRARQFNVHVTAGNELVEGPYIAETLQVEQDGEYLVVEL
ncbi:MAG: Rieske (2Fe-2S) protein [Beijerinckiaceae bacterium]|nr:Rieske (2Fe-2S) protein [Beijerinckiaceae bacterium]